MSDRLRLVCLWLATLVVGALLTPPAALAAVLALPTVTSYDGVPRAATYGSEHVLMRGQPQATTSSAQEMYTYDDFARHTRLFGVAPGHEESVRATTELPVTIALRRVAAKSGDELLDAARVARDAKAAEVGRTKATVTGGYGRDGVPTAGCSSNPVGCAEDDVARQIGGDPKDITFTEAIRPRTGEQVPICPRCQGTYDQSQFPAGTLFDPAGPWGSR